MDNHDAKCEIRDEILFIINKHSKRGFAYDLDLGWSVPCSQYEDMIKEIEDLP